MIAPIQPVGWNGCLPAAPPCSLRFDLACALTFRTLYGSWFCPAVIIDPPDSTEPPGGQPPRRYPPGVCPPERRPIEWAPWPSTPSRVTEPGRWWPGNELPPIPPPAPPRAALQTIIIPVPTYGRLNLWA